MRNARLITAAVVALATVATLALAGPAAAAKYCNQQPNLRHERGHRPGLRCERARQRPEQPRQGHRGGRPGHVLAPRRVLVPVVLPTTRSS
jgi:hypothetical protein